MPEYKLTYYNVPGIVEPIRYMFALAGVPYEDHHIHKNETNYPVLPPEIKDNLPWGCVPILEVDGKVIAQSAAIARFLARKFHLAGADDYEAAKCDEYLDALKDFGAEWHALLQEKDSGKRLAILTKLKEVGIPKYLGKFNSIIETNGGKWLVGSKVTWTDIALPHSITMINTHAKISIADGYPAVENLIQSVYDIPQIKEWIEKRPSTE